MNEFYNLTSRKSCQFFLIFILALSFTRSVLALESRKDFICGYNSVIEYVNGLISKDRHRATQSLKSLYNKKNLKREDAVELITTLMRYRLLPISNHKKCQFFSYLCLPDQGEDTVYDLAWDYLEAHNMKMPDFCYIRFKGKYEKRPLLSKACLLAIQKRVRAIPAPLAIAQAGLESNWGKSNFSKRGYNFYGVQTLFSSAAKTRNNIQQCLVPRNNPKRCVYKFNSIEMNFFIYSQILNSASSYTSLRNYRDLGEKNGITPCKVSLEMAEGLSRYAEDPNYVKKIQSIITRVCPVMENC